MVSFDRGVKELEQHESRVAMQTLESIKRLLEVYQKTIENERYKTDQKNKVDIIKFIIIAITTLIIAAMLILTPATMDIRNVSESKSEVVTDVSDR